MVRVDVGPMCILNAGNHVTNALVVIMIWSEFSLYVACNKPSLIRVVILFNSLLSDLFV